MPPQLDELLARVDLCSTQAIELSTHFQELREQIRQAIDIAQRDPEMSLIRSRKVLEYIVVDIYDEALKPKRAGTQPLEGLVQALVKEGQFPNRLAAYADMVRGLGNVGAHGRDKAVSAQDVLNSLSNLLPIVEWFFEHRKMPGAESAPLAAASRIDSAAPSSSAQRIASPTDTDSQPRRKLEPGSSAVRPAAELARAASKTSPPSESRCARGKLWAIGAVPVILAACGIWYVTHRNVAPAVSTDTTAGQPVTPSAPNETNAKLPSTAATPGDASAQPPTITNSIGMKLALIPAGDFTMGSPETESGARNNEHPQHRVRITKPFYLGTYSVTRGDFAKFVAATNHKTLAETSGIGGSGYAGGTGANVIVQKPEYNWRNTGFAQTDEHPVVNVSWNDAQAFCKWLSDQEGKTYRLPTEAEWEYACRAGTTTSYFFGDNPQDLVKHAQTYGSPGYTVPVGSFPPNPFGLYDMLGNAWQWSADWYAPDYYKLSPPADPKGPPEGTTRMTRGGGWLNSSAQCRCAFRAPVDPAYCDCNIGFRVALEPEPAAPRNLPATSPTPSGSSAKLPTTANSIGMKLTLIPAGEFMMGSTKSEIGAQDDEHPPHLVRITKPFYLGTYSVTRGKFTRFVAATNYQTDAEKDGKGGTGYTGDVKNQFAQKPEFTWRNTGFEQTDEHPVVNISWNDAVAFCRWLSEQEGKTYRLPTEAEWEYACRAGTTTAYFFGDNPDDLMKFANVADATFKNMVPSRNAMAASDGFAFTAPVGSFQPNAFGLCDMLGNAWQWCSDWRGTDYYQHSPPADPQGPAAGAERVMRGGSWGYVAASCRCSSRDGAAPNDSYSGVGFRVVREP